MSIRTSYVTWQCPPCPHKGHATNLAPSSDLRVEQILNQWGSVSVVRISELFFGQWSEMLNYYPARHQTIQSSRGHHAPPPALGASSQSEAIIPTPDQSEARSGMTRAQLMLGIVTSPDMIYRIDRVPNPNIIWQRHGMANELKEKFSVFSSIVNLDKEIWFSPRPVSRVMKHERDLVVSKPA